MIKTIRASERYFSDFGWLKTYWLFSFDHYHDPANMQFGSLRVFNDDVVAGQNGFPTHPHREMEIITAVLAGEVSHEDSMGNQTVIKPGEVQRMSAGTGITHSEYNRGDAPVHLYQIWVLPDERRLKPSYDQRSFSTEQRKNRLLAVASGKKTEHAVTLNTDATIYMADFDAGHRVSFTVEASRGLFLYVTSGDLGINDERLTTKDHARITDVDSLTIEAYDDTSFVLIDVPVREA